MPIRFACPCGHGLVAQEKHAGRKAKCNRCGRELIVPVPAVRPRDTRPARPAETVIKVRRVKKPANVANNATVYIDGEDCGWVASGESETYDVAPGEHTVEVESGTARSPAFAVTLRAGETVQFECDVVGGFAQVEVSLRCVRKPASDAVRETGTTRPTLSGLADGGKILLFGCLSFCIGLFGIAAIGMAISHFNRVRERHFDSSGVALAVLGIILGTVGLLLNVAVGILIVGARLFD